MFCRRPGRRPARLGFFFQRPLTLAVPGGKKPRLLAATRLPNMRISKGSFMGPEYGPLPPLKGSDVWARSCAGPMLRDHVTALRVFACRSGFRRRAYAG